MFDGKAFVATLGALPGVYCMRDKAGHALYVGKAKNLKSRVASYFRSPSDKRSDRFVRKIASIEITVTTNEKEALLLENTLIKSLKPRYNVIFRDDKSYPYFYLSEHVFPRLTYFRGKQKVKGKLFGPYPSVSSVYVTLGLLQKKFQLRQCEDHFFAHRSRPCLQYQIDRCSAPCVGYISKEAYALSVKQVVRFLEGKPTEMIAILVKEMEAASSAYAFEKAAELRDLIQHLRAIHEEQSVSCHKGNADVIALLVRAGHICIQLLYVRQGQVLDTHAFFPEKNQTLSEGEALRQFLIQCYLGNTQLCDLPPDIIIGTPIVDQAIIEEGLSERAGHPVRLICPNRGEQRAWLALAERNAEVSLTRRLSENRYWLSRWEALREGVGIASLGRLECFDISHLQGEDTIASCVVFTESGPFKNDWRTYSLKDVKGDDYAAMTSVLTQRYLKRKKENRALPDIVLVDGGKGQWHAAKKALENTQCLEILLIAIAKGALRKRGQEKCYMGLVRSQEESIVHFSPKESAFLLLQHIRDEAHRFAVRGHRKRRTKHWKQIPLESISGIGVERQKRLLQYFGGYQALCSASQAAIAEVPGIGEQLAEKIYQFLHPPSSL